MGNIDLNDNQNVHNAQLNNNNGQMSSFLNRTSTQSKGESNKNKKETNSNDKEKESSFSPSSKRYSFISSGEKCVQLKTETNKLLFDKSSYSHSPSLSMISKNKNTNSCTISQLSCDCEQVMNIKDKRLKLNENEILLNNIILDEEIAIAPRLTIEDLDGNLLNGKKLLIDAAGLFNSIRKKRDGIVFFGLHNSSIVSNNNDSSNCNDNEPLDDFKLNIPNVKCTLDHLLMIYYHRKTATYFMKSFIKEINNCTIIMTLKVNKPYVINKKTFAVIGNIMVIIDVGNYTFNKDSKENEEIKITIVHPKKKDSNCHMGKNKEYKFKVSNCNHVTIGREDCSINLNHKYYSKPHCSIYYNTIINMWELSDGDPLGNKGSTHGTWVLINNDLSLGDYDEYVIKFNKQTIRIVKEQEY